jgi:RNA exonuclease 1
LGVVEPEIIDVDEDNAVDPVDAVEEAFAKLNDRLSKLHDSLPARTIFMLMTGNGDPRPVVKLNEKRRTFEIKYKKLGESASQKLPEEEKWTTQDERDLSDAVNRARFGMAFFCVKNPPK